MPSCVPREMNGLDTELFEQRMTDGIFVMNSGRRRLGVFSVAWMYKDRYLEFIRQAAHLSATCNVPVRNHQAGRNETATG